MPPPLQTAAPSPGTRESDAGSPRGNLKLEAHSDQLIYEKRWRVITADGETLRKGDLVAARLRYALEAPNGRRIPIPSDDLHAWLDDHYTLPTNSKGEQVAIVRDKDLHGLWAGGKVGDVHLQRGDWRILQSDEAVVKVTQMHTIPLAQITFGRTQRGILAARYLKMDDPNAVAKFGDSDSTGVCNKNTFK